MPFAPRLPHSAPTPKRTAGHCVPAMLILALVLGSPGCGDDPSPRIASTSCADVAFTANSDNLAAGIRAIGIDCPTARAFIRASDGAPDTDRDGFRCTSKRVDAGSLIHTQWRCERDDAAITWDRY